MKALTLCFLLPILCLAADAQDPKPLPLFNLWSGREQSLPFVAKKGWRVETEHGRLLANGQAPGPVRLSFPPLAGRTPALLLVDGTKRARMMIQPVRLLDGIVAECSCHEAELEALGVQVVFPDEDGEASCLFLSLESYGRLRRRSDAPASRIVVFTDEDDFPIVVPDEWVEFSVGINKEKGTLGVIMDGRERIVDHSPGGVAWLIALDREGSRTLLLPPEFDLDDVDNILFLKKELER